MRKRTSPIWAVDKVELQAILDSSDSFVEVFKKLGVDPYSGNHKTLNARIREENLSIEILADRRKKARLSHLENLNKTRLSDEEVFAIDSGYDRKHLKRRILENGWLEYRCEECGIGDTYNNKPISLQLDHKNGSNNDNRIENLRFLCPNCHSQTPTFGKRKLKRDKQAKVRSFPRKFDPDKEELEAMVKKLPMTKVGLHYGVSDSAVRKRCKLLGIIWN